MSDDALREQIGRILGGGLVTLSQQRAGTSEQVSAVCQRLQALAGDDVQARLVSAGFLTRPWVASVDDDGIEQSCATCMYFERHRRFCALPELTLPVDPEWSCVLWRI